jgi:uncharacterized protein
LSYYPLPVTTLGITDLRAGYPFDFFCSYYCEEISVKRLTLMGRSTFSIEPIRRVIPVMIGCLSLTMVSPAFAQESLIRTLTVTGQGTESVATTLSQITLGVEVQGETAEAVQQEVAQRSNTIVEQLRSREGVTKLQTAGLYLNPVYDYSNNTARITGYTGVNTVSFRVPTAQAGALLDDMIQAGATRIDGVSFVAEDAAIAEARQQAIREATEDAQSQADATLAALGLTRGEIIGIQVNGAALTPPIPFLADRAVQAAESVPTPVVGGEQEVQASVTLQITY